jgi:hypothetical protein
MKFAHLTLHATESKSCLTQKIIFPNTQILACDGIWDVITNQQAAEIAYGHLRAGEEKLAGFGPKFDGKFITSNGSLRPDVMMNNKFSSGNLSDTTISTCSAYGAICPRINNAAQQAARGLVRESWQKYSLDNLTAVVVRLKHVSPETKAIEKARRAEAKAEENRNEDRGDAGGSGGSGRGPLIPGMSIGSSKRGRDNSYSPRSGDGGGGGGYKRAKMEQD